MNRDRELAEQQLTGYYAAKHGDSILELITAMGLNEMEWSLIKIDQHFYIPNNDIKIIDEYFENK